MAKLECRTQLHLNPVQPLQILYSVIGHWNYYLKKHDALRYLGHKEFEVLLKSLLDNELFTIRKKCDS